MSIGFRPKGESGPAYHPDRDYAYTTPTLMKMAIERMDDSALTEEERLWKNANNITEAEIIAVVEALARAQRDFINAADPVNSLEQALARRDFFDLRYPVRQFLFAAIGSVFCAAWFTAVREVTKIGEHSPSESGMLDFIGAVKAFVRRPGCPTIDGNITVAQLQFRLDVLQSRNNVLYAQLQQLTTQLQQLNAQLTEARAVKTAAPKAPFFSWFAGLRMRRPNFSEFTRK